MTLSRSKLCQRWRKLLDGSTRSQASKESLLSRWPLFFPRFERRFGMSSCWGGSLVTYIYFFGFIRSGWFFSLKTGHFEEFSVFFGVISAKVTFNIKKDPKLHIWHIQKKCPSKTSFQKKKCQNIFSTYRKDPRRRGNLIHTCYRIRDFPRYEESFRPHFLSQPGLGNPNQSRTCFPKMQSPAKGSVSKELMKVEGCWWPLPFPQVGDLMRISGGERSFITLFTLENMIYIYPAKS